MHAEENTFRPATFFAPKAESPGKAQHLEPLLLRCPPRLLALICRSSSTFLSRLQTRSGRHEVRVSSPRPREGRPRDKAHLRRILHPAARVLNRRFLALHRRNNAVPSIANARREICRLHNSASPPKPRGIRRQIDAPQRLFMPERPTFAAKEAQKNDRLSSR